MDDSLYDELAGVESDHWWVQGRRQIVASVLRQRLGAASANRRILDVGCGTGEMLEMLLEFGTVTGLDMSPRAAEHCRRRFGKRLDIRLGRVPDDIEAPAHIVTAFDVLEHLDDDIGAVKKIGEILCPNGVFVCTVPAFRFLWSRHDEIHHHRRRYTRRSLRAALEAGGLRVERITYFNTVLFPLIAAIRMAHNLRPSANESDLSMPSARVNTVLTRLFASEGRFLRRGGFLPVGVSLLAVCGRVPQPAGTSSPEPAQTAS